MNNQSKLIYTREEMKRAEAAADAAGTSYEELMENAGCAAAKTLMKWATPNTTMLLLCGSGNNAGDAFVLARILAEQDIKISFLPFGELMEKPYSPLAVLNLARLPHNVQRVCMETAFWQADIIVDAVYGTGFRGALPPLVQKAFGMANASPALRVALDIPSGLDCDTAQQSEGCFRAAHTLCFGAYKPALLQKNCADIVGTVHCLDIGL